MHNYSNPVYRGKLYDDIPLRPIELAPALAAAVYPFLLILFNALVGPSGYHPDWLHTLCAVIILICAFSTPMLGVYVACGQRTPTSIRHLSYLSVVAPTLYVFLGVVQTLISSPFPETWVWCAFWSGALFWAYCKRNYQPVKQPCGLSGSWRVAHGVSALILCIYILFHLGNHLMGLIGPAEHESIMDLGRKVYRAKFIEPVLILLFLFQVFSGLRLAWSWSSARQDIFRTFQIASGIYLSIFILGHMNSVFIYARTYLDVPTGWNFATGAPTGLIHDSWNIRLLPHYGLGVFFVLSHLASGLRVVLKTHGLMPRIANRIWFISVLFSASIAAAILAGMCGFRI
jgi:hypothetical protein